MIWKRGWLHPEKSKITVINIIQTSSRSRTATPGSWSRWPGSSSTPPSATIPLCQACLDCPSQRGRPQRRRRLRVWRLQEELRGRGPLQLGWGRSNPGRGCKHKQGRPASQLLGQESQDPIRGLENTLEEEKLGGSWAELVELQKKTDLVFKLN